MTALRELGAALLFIALIAVLLPVRLLAFAARMVWLEWRRGWGDAVHFVAWLARTR